MRGTDHWNWCARIGPTTIVDKNGWLAHEQFVIHRLTQHPTPKTPIKQTNRSLVHRNLATIIFTPPHTKNLINGRTTQLPTQDQVERQFPATMNWSCLTARTVMTVTDPFAAVNSTSAQASSPSRQERNNTVCHVDVFYDNYFWQPNNCSWHVLWLTCFDLHTAFSSPKTATPATNFRNNK